jgi:TPR repeat protein
LIADTCCSGFLTKRGGLESREVVSLLSDPSRTILAATTQHEAAREGVFTKELVTILNQSAKDSEPLSVTDVFQKLRYTVPKRAGIKMTPQMSHVGAGDGEFVFIPRSVGAEEVAKLKEAVAEVKKGIKVDNGKLVAFRGVLERKQKLLGRQNSLADVILALHTPDHRLCADAEAQARRWEGIRRGFQENAGLGDIWGMAGLHFCCARGLGGEKSSDDAYYWAKQADLFSKPAGVGQFLLGRSYELGIGVKKNEITATKLYRESAKNGFPLGKWALAMSILRANPSADDLREARDLLQQAHAEGAVIAAPTLAKFYFGLLPGAKKDIKAGIKLLEEAAANDITEAQQALYEFWSRDRPGSPKDMRKAISHLFKAAELGHGHSQQLIASQYYREEPFGVVFDLPKNYKSAFEWASLAAQHPDPSAAGTAHLLLSFLYERGHGVEVNIDKMKHHLEEGVRLNHANSMYFLGSRLISTDGKYKQDPERAFTLAQASAASGNPNGQYLLGFMYHKWKDPMTGKFGFRIPSDTDYNGWTHHILHNYFHAYQKGVRNKEIPGFLVTFLKCHKAEQDGGAAAFRKIATESRLPSLVFARLQEEYPETAKQLLTAKIDGVR